MFKEIFLFELKTWFKKPSTYIFFAVFFGFTMLITAAMGGLLGPTVSDSNSFINSAKAIAEILSSMSTDIVGSIILISIIAPAVYKDFQHNTHPLLFTKPITKAGYLFGRFTASFVVALFVISGSVFGHIVSCFIPGMEQGLLGPFNLLNYLQPFILFAIPNVLLIGALFFSLVTFTRNMIAGYVGCVTLVIVKSMATSMLSDMDNQSLAAVIEPFGEQALKKVVKYWSPSEQNTLLIPLEKELLYNRLLWLGIAAGITLLTYFRFQFSQVNETLTWFKRKSKKEFLSVASSSLQSLADLPKVVQTFTTGFSIYQIWYLTKFEFFKIVKSIFFLIIVALSIFGFVAVSGQLGLIYGTATYPVTYQMLQLGGGIFQFFMIILIVFYSGVVIWRERDVKIDEFTGTSPTPPWTSYTSKLIALIGVQILLLFVIMLTGITVQMYNGYYNVEPLQYIKELFGFKLISLTLICVLAMALQVVINQKYVAYFVAAAIVIVLPIILQLLEWNNPLAQYNSSGPRLPYSDMNGYGHIIYPFILYKIYWSSFALILIVLSNLLWVRSKEKGFKVRLRIAASRFNIKAKLAGAAGLLVFILTGSFIYYNTNILNKNISSKEEEKMQADYEKQYKHYSKTPQPRIVAVNWNVNIFPDKRGTSLQGYYIIKNKTAKPIDSVIINYYTEVNIDTLTFNTSATNVLNDDKTGFKIYKLATPLQPGDSVQMNMQLSYFPKGFKSSDAGTSIVANGSFFNNMVLPSIGYLQAGELNNDNARKKHGLDKKERMSAVSDSIARMNTYISNDADWIDFECIVSTTSDQIAIAPGYLQKDWEENDRHYFQYKMDCKILNFYSFLSAHYEIKREKWISTANPTKEVAIEIYYHKGHEYNIERMIKSIKKSLDYYTINFSPYQHKQVRIIEFPRYASFAQSFPNTIPFSEGIGFIAKVNDTDPESIDYPFYVTAHEVAHQWWAHQVIGGNVQGSTLMAETMAQYSALMVMEKEYGAKAMKKFLKHEMSSYLQGRGLEGKKEQPLILVENQQYIHYNKGSVVMYALKDYIGEDSLNAALASYIKKVAYQEPPFTNSIEFVNYLRAATPDSLKYIINDMFETITIYENKTLNCSYSKTSEGKYLVKISIEGKKMKADSIGKLKDIAINDWIDIGIFGTKELNGKTEETELYLHKHKIDKPKMEFEFIVNEEPIKAGIDPYQKLIDRNHDNNTLKMGSSIKAEAKAQGETVSIKVKA